MKVIQTPNFVLFHFGSLFDKKRVEVDCQPTMYFLFVECLILETALVCELSCLIFPCETVILIIVIGYVTIRLGQNIKREIHGLKKDWVTLLHVWAMEDSIKDFLSVEVGMVLKHMMTCGCWTQSQERWRR